jgi:hypothetical protein
MCNNKSKYSNLKLLHTVYVEAFRNKGTKGPIRWIVAPSRLSLSVFIENREYRKYKKE